MIIKRREPTLQIDPADRYDVELRERIKMNGVSTVARAAGLSPKTVQRWVGGHEFLPVSTIKRICAAADCLPFFEFQYGGQCS